jgi:hypothetical protein
VPTASPPIDPRPRAFRPGLGPAAPAGAPSYREPPLPPHPVYSPLSEPGGRPGPAPGPIATGPVAAVPVEDRSRPREPAFEPRPPAGNIEIGEIKDNIPRTQRVGEPMGVEVRISTAAIRQVMPGPARVLEAIAVRLAANDSGFNIEPHTPETQWLDPRSPPAEEFLSWRWTLTPLIAGSQELALQVAARAIIDGLVADETRLEDQPIDVEVRGPSGVGRALGRLVMLLVAFAAGVAVARLAPGVIETALKAIPGLTGH